jgi:hypothetical protein
MEPKDPDTSRDVEVEAEAPEAVVFWWKRKQKRKRLKICRFRFHSVSTLYQSCCSNFGRSYFFHFLFDIYLSELCQNYSFFLNNDVKYHITNCITTFQKQKWKPIWK